MAGYKVHPVLGNGFILSIVLLSVISILLIIQYCCLKREHCQCMIVFSSLSLTILFLVLLACELCSFFKKSVALASIQFISYILLIIVFIVYTLPILCIKVYEVIPITKHSLYLGILMACGYVLWRFNWMVFSVFQKYKRIACFSYNLIVFLANGIAWVKFLDFSTFSIEDTNMLLGYLDL